MANNRMWLIHRPSKLGIKLGKRMAVGWYDAPEKDEVERFFQYLEDNSEGSQDDFILTMDDGAESSVVDNWRCTGDEIDGFRVFYIFKREALLDLDNKEVRDNMANNMEKPILK